MDRAADLWTLVSNLKNAAYDEQVHILQALGDKLINDCRIEVFGVTIEPLWVEAYCYDETHFPDTIPIAAASKKTDLDRCISMSEATAVWIFAYQIRRISACPFC